MFLARHSTVAKASVLLAGAFFALVFPIENSRAKSPPGACENGADLAVLTAPFAPWKGAPLRVIFAAENSSEGELSLIAPDGHVAARSREQSGGPPYFWFSEVASPAVGTWRATLARSGCGTVTREIAVRGEKSAPMSAVPGTVWP
ncbi:MAG TPA: hypothetical protein VEH02_06580, partial [Pseudolabrys sp.]|nr:hypothetical protein [Pseudolabrys sp.]